MDKQKIFYVFSKICGIIRLGEGEEKSIWTFGGGTCNLFKEGVI